VIDCSGRRRTYSQRSSGASKISSASAGVGAPPAEPLIFDRPFVPTKEYPKCSGISPPKIGTSSPPTVKLDPGEAWSTPAGSKVTCS
jgi:hypothetical protein